MKQEKTYDLEYITTGIFTSILPNTKQGKIAWNQMLEQNEGTDKIFTMHLQNILAQFRRAGYSIRKAPKPKMSLNDILNSDDELLKELNA